MKKIPKLYIELTRNYDWVCPEFINRYVRKHYNVQTFFGNDVALLPKNLREDMFRDCDIAVSCVTPITAELMDLSQRLKMICAFGAGYDQIDVKAATERGIPVVNCRGCNRTAVAELVIGMMIMLSRNLLSIVSSMQKNIWRSTMGNELYGRTIGIVGMGNTGGELARICKDAFGMKILVNDIRPDQEILQRYGAVYAELDTLFAEADYISVHVPYTPNTVRLVNRERLALMKPTAFIINTSRGGVLDEQALFNAIKEKRIAGAGLDVFEHEPYVNNIFAQFPNVITTTHCGGNTPESVKRMAEVIQTEIDRVLAGGLPQNNIINSDAFKQASRLQRQ